MCVRKTIPAALCTVAVLSLSGCAGFLVPAGEGEPAPAGSPAAPSPVPAVEVPDTPAGAPAQGAPSPTAVTGDCPPAGVTVDMGEVQTAMFHRAVVLTLTNCGKEPYRVHGYPAVRALGEEGERLAVPVNPGGSMFGNDEGPEEVMLKPGGAVRSTLAWVSTEEGSDLIEGDALEISAAPDTGARVFPLEGHDLRLMDELNTTAWRTSTTG
ncbi:DUF4232 domain-containing protein [Streptomyces argenteolus]|uniref:DUF4232 domain-containing protein n=1 Tax=Streptomyces argenteolus TaxID=67274 RepID=A0ABW6X591_9ACTN